MAFNQQEQEIIKYGLANGKTKEQVTQALTNLRTGVIPPKKEVSTPSFLQRAGEDINQAGSKITDILSASNDKSVLNKGVEATATAFNTIPKVGYEALPQPVRQGLDIVGEKIGQGFNALTNLIGSNPDLQKWTTENPEAFKKLTDTLGTVSSAGQIAGDILLADQTTKALQGGVNLTKNVAKKGTELVKQESKNITQGVGKLRENAPPEIMNRVLRLKPTDAQKFKKMTGETQGQYATRTGNFQAPDKFIEGEATKFVKSLKSADTEFAKMPGVYQDGSITDAINGLYEKAIKTSSSNVPSPYLRQVQDLMAKYKSGGLTMDEINGVKRLFEREVKLGYSKLINPDGVATATNIDSALRKWQFAKAKELGFKNIDVINKQTQASKFLVDKLGEQLVGQNGLNSVNLTDWVILSGGDPSSIAGFLTKKFFSSKTVQAKIAKILNQKEIQPHINPDVGLSQVKQLTAPKTGSPQSSINVPINQPSRRAIQQGTEIVTPSKKISPQSSTKVLQSYNGSIPQSEPNSKVMDIFKDDKLVDSTEIGKKFDALAKTKSLKVKGTIPENSLISEAKKYKTSEEFVNNQEVVYHASRVDNIKIIEPRTPKLATNLENTISFGSDKNEITHFGTNVYERYVYPKKPFMVGKNQNINTVLPEVGKENIAPYLRKNGYDAIIKKTSYGGKEIVILDPKVIKTKSQLTDIWKKANKK